ncbi:MAG: hypothetical protein M3Z04_24740 [Chloroflexota bacterium]|nr:hypothetical protein [Chloroflexota bacterium]
MLHIRKLAAESLTQETFCPIAVDGIPDFLAGDHRHAGRGAGLRTGRDHQHQWPNAPRSPVAAHPLNVAGPVQPLPTAKAKAHPRPRSRGRRAGGVWVRD